MEFKKFLELFAEQFDNKPIEALQAKTKFRDLPEWGSLTALSIISMVDEELEKRITGADIRSVSTIEELYTLVQSK